MKKIIQLIFIVFTSVIVSEFLFNLLSETHKIRSDSTTITFYVLGGSTAYGEPYNEHIDFASLIKENFNGYYEGKKIEIKMIATSGAKLAYNINEFIKEMIIARQKNGVLLIYSDINDRFSFESKDEPSEIEKILSQTFIGSLMHNYFSPRDYNKHKNSKIYYRYRLTKLIKWAKKMDYPVFISSLAGNFHDYPPHPQRKLSKEEIVDIIKCEKIKNDERKISCLKIKSIKSKTYDYYIDWLTSIDMSFTNKFKKLDKYHFTDTSKSRPDLRKNNIIKEVSDSFDNVTYVSFYEKLNLLENKYIGNNYFADAHHPNLKALVILSNEFEKKLLSKKISFLNYVEVSNKYKIKRKDNINKICMGRIRWYLSTIIAEEYSFVLFGTMQNTLEKLGCSINIYKRIVQIMFYPLVPIKSPRLSAEQIEIEVPSFKEWLIANNMKNLYVKKFQKNFNQGLISKSDFNEYFKYLK